MSKIDEDLMNNSSETLCMIKIKSDLTIFTSKPFKWVIWSKNLWVNISFTIFIFPVLNMDDDVL